MMANWTACVGYPVVHVESLGNGKFRATQNRFLNTGPSSAEDDTAVWWINLAVNVNGKVHPITFKSTSIVLVYALPKYGGHAHVQYDS